MISFAEKMAVKKAPAESNIQQERNKGASYEKFDSTHMTIARSKKGAGKLTIKSTGSHHSKYLEQLEVTIL